VRYYDNYGSDLDGAADAADKATKQAQTTTQEAKTMMTDSWVTSKAKIALFADERVKGT